MLLRSPDASCSPRRRGSWWCKVGSRSRSTGASLSSAYPRGAIQNRLSFVMQAVGAFAISFLDFVMIVVIFQHLRQLAGWTSGEVAFLYGTSYIVVQGGRHVDDEPRQARRSSSAWGRSIRC